MTLIILNLIRKRHFQTSQKRDRVNFPRTVWWGAYLNNTLDSSRESCYGRCIVSGGGAPTLATESSPTRGAYYDDSTVHVPGQYPQANLFILEDTFLWFTVPDYIIGETTTVPVSYPSSRPFKNPSIPLKLLTRNCYKRRWDSSFLESGRRLSDAGDETGSKTRTPSTSLFV